MKIKAHSEYQYNKCQEYLKGNIVVTDMFPLMATYWNEIVSLIGWSNVSDRSKMSDKECCYKFCKAMKLN